MASKREAEEEIIELTDVIEEGPAATTAENRTEGGGEPKVSPAPPVEPERPAPLFSISEPEVVPPLANYDSEIMPFQEEFKKRVEAWIADEGAKIMERAARQAFPKIAEEVLKREIEKLKEESEEQE